MANRIYVVTEVTATDTKKHLVKAANSSQAIRHVVEPRFVAELASQDELVELAGSGVRVQIAHE